MIALAIACWVSKEVAIAADPLPSTSPPADAAYQELVEREKGRDLSHLAFARARAGDYEGAIRAYGSSGLRGEAGLSNLESAIENFERHEVLPAIEAIVAEARDRQIVILNEAHHIARHRILAHFLARRLREIGFEYLACETFGADVSGLAQRGYPKVLDGYFSREPLYADFLRESLRLGFTPITYETDGRNHRPDMQDWESINQRESDQAENLVARIFRKNPKARVFIYVGYSHITKKETSWGLGEKPPIVKWMAGRLKTATGIDPLTIDQTVMTDPPADSKRAKLLERIFAQQDRSVSAVVLRRPAQPGYVVIGPYHDDADMQVFYRATAMVDGRPGWLAMGGYRTPTPIPSELLPKETRRLVKAYFAHEEAGAIAVDQVLVQPGDPRPPVFMLPQGKFRFTFEE